MNYLDAKRILSINVLKSLKANLALKVFIFKRTYFKKYNNAKLNIDGRLFLGVTWAGLSYGRTMIKIGNHATLNVYGNFKIFSGALFTIDEGGVVNLGSGYINYNAHISCFKKISIGNDVVISENVTIRDSDNHNINYDGYEIARPVIIQNHVWIGINATILKVVTVNSGSIVAAGAVVVKDVPANTLVAGVPAKVIKRNVNWS